jgi:hypothetical protein
MDLIALLEKAGTVTREEAAHQHKNAAPPKTKKKGLTTHHDLNEFDWETDFLEVGDGLSLF